MKVHLTPQFLNDLRSSDDARFIRRVLDQVFDRDGMYRPDPNDHRMRDVEDAWIRYVSAGRTAYRLIYIKKGDDIFLFRAGGHSIEDEVVTIAVESIARGATSNPALNLTGGNPHHSHMGDLLKTSQPKLLSKVLHALRFVRHREIYLVSPFISEATMHSRAPFGSFIDRAIEENTAVVLVTRACESPKWNFLDDLESRGIMLHLHPSLHAKLYVFEVDSTTTGPFNCDISATAILGSANLTEQGLSLSGDGGNEELCYRLPLSQYWEAKQYAEWLIMHSTDYLTYKSRATRRF